MQPPYASRINAADIPVSGFRTTLLWPLTLDLPDAATLSATTREAFVQRQAALLLASGHWSHVQDQLDHLGDEDVAASYAEMTYFHEFVQSFLFARHSTSLLTDATSEEPVRLAGENTVLPPVTLLRRDDQRQVDICLQGGGPHIWFRLNLLRLNLYILPLGVAVMALEVEHPEGAPVYLGAGQAGFLPGGERPCGDGWEPRPLTLADVQRFNDRFRRAHAPFIEPKAGGGFEAPAYVPVAVVWHGRQGSRPFNVNAGPTAPAAIATGLRALPPGARAIPPFQHFAWLLGEGEQGWRIGPRNAEEPSWSHMADDRLPVVTTILLPDAIPGETSAYDQISDGDWARLCFVDEPGSNAYPYAKAFLERDWTGHVYDRFHYGNAESTSPPSRYLISGYSLTAVGYGGFFREHIRRHMRRHYFQLMLLAQIERAVLLAVSGRITQAVARYETSRGSPKGVGEAEARLEEGLQQVEHDFLQYVHRFRFTGVSDQVQPTEIYAQLRARMRLPELYADIKDELTTATAFLALRSQQREAESAARLSIVATFGVILGLAFAFLGMNVIVEDGVLGMIGLDNPPDGLKGGARLFRALAVLSGTIALSSFVGLLLARVTGSPRRGQDRLGNRLRWVLRGMAIGGATLTGLLLVIHPVLAKIFRWG